MLHWTLSSLAQVWLVIPSNLDFLSIGAVNDSSQWTLKIQKVLFQWCDSTSEYLYFGLILLSIFRPINHSTRNGFQITVFWWTDFTRLSIAWISCRQSTTCWFVSPISASSQSPFMVYWQTWYALQYTAHCRYNMAIFTKSLIVDIPNLPIRSMCFLL